jgi:hypothetical protein
MESIIKYFFDRQIRISSKAAFIVIGIALILILNDIFNFSSSYVINDKISQIKELNAIIKDSATDEKTKYYAINARQEIIENSNCINNSIDYFKNISWENKVEMINNPNDREVIEASQKENIKLNVILQHLTSGGFFYILGIIFVFVIIFDKNQELLDKLGTSIFVLIIFFLIGWFWSAIIGLIPIIDKNQIWINYTVNLAAQGIGLFALYKLIDKTNSRNPV